MTFKKYPKFKGFDFQMTFKFKDFDFQMTFKFKDFDFQMTFEIQRLRLSNDFQNDLKFSVQNKNQDYLTGLGSLADAEDDLVSDEGSSDAVPTEYTAAQKPAKKPASSSSSSSSSGKAGGASKGGGSHLYFFFALFHL